MNLGSSLKITNFIQVYCKFKYRVIFNYEYSRQTQVDVYLDKNILNFIKYI